MRAFLAGVVRKKFGLAVAQPISGGFGIGNQACSRSQNAPPGSSGLTQLPVNAAAARYHGGIEGLAADRATGNGPANHQGKSDRGLVPLPDIMMDVVS